MGDRADGQGLNLMLSVLDDSGAAPLPAAPSDEAGLREFVQRLAVSPSAMAVFSLSTMYAHRH